MWTYVRERDMFVGARTFWSRWTTEYIRSLRERHNLKHKTQESTLKVGDVVSIQSEERNRGKWSIGIVVKLIKGRDWVVRGARLRAGKSYLERAIQPLCPMELSCDVREIPPNQPVQLNPRARDFTPRRAVVVPAQQIRDIAEKKVTELSLLSKRDYELLNLLLAWNSYCYRCLNSGGMIVFVPLGCIK